MDVIRSSGFFFAWDLEEEEDEAVAAAGVVVSAEEDVVVVVALRELKELPPDRETFVW